MLATVLGGNYSPVPRKRGGTTPRLDYAARSKRSGVLTFSSSSVSSLLWLPLPDDVTARLEGKSSLGAAGFAHALVRRIHRSAGAGVVIVPARPAGRAGTASCAAGGAGEGDRVPAGCPGARSIPFAEGAAMARAALDDGARGSRAVPRTRAGDRPRRNRDLGACGSSFGVRGCRGHCAPAHGPPASCRQRVRAGSAAAVPARLRSRGTFAGRDRLREARSHDVLRTLVELESVRAASATLGMQHPTLRERLNDYVVWP